MKHAIIVIELIGARCPECGTLQENPFIGGEAFDEITWNQHPATLECACGAIFRKPPGVFERPVRAEGDGDGDRP